MRLLIRDRQSETYLIGDGRWTKLLKEARDFGAGGVQTGNLQTPQSIADEGNAYLPAYFDGFRIRSSRSVSNSSRAIRCRLCSCAIAMVLGRSQARLTKLTIVNQITLTRYINSKVGSMRSTILVKLEPCRRAFFFHGFGGQLHNVVLNSGV